MINFVTFSQFRRVVSRVKSSVAIRKCSYITVKRVKRVMLNEEIQRSSLTMSNRLICFFKINSNEQSAKIKFFVDFELKL